MKHLYKFLIALFIVMAWNYTTAQAQCTPSEYSQECIPKIQDGFIFYKSFNIDGQNGAKEKVEYSLVFTKDTQYYLNICTSEENTDGIVVTIYDSKRNQVSTNFANGKFFPGIIFQCNSTGIYYIAYTFRDSKNYCGGSVLAFKK